MILSPNGERFIENAEGCRLKAYICPAGKLTIGYGHRIGPHDPQVITQAQADALFKEDIIRYAGAVSEAVQVCVCHKPNQNQFDALTAFVFNIGIGAWNGSTARRDMIQDRFGDIPHELSRWVHDDHGNVIQGLVNRRNAEIGLFKQPALN